MVLGLWPALFLAQDASKVILPASEPPACVEIQRIDITGLMPLSSKRLQTLKAPYLNTCLPLARLPLLVEALSEAYFAAGFVTSRVGLPMPQTRLSEGILAIGVEEGRIAAITHLDGHPLPFNLFPGLTGEVLNLREMERGLEHINRLGAYDASMTLVADKKAPDHSQVVIDYLREARRWQGRLSVDNSGSLATGELRGTLGLTVDNLLGLYDSLSASLVREISENTDRRRSRAFTLDVSLPYGSLALELPLLPVRLSHLSTTREHGYLLHLGRYRYTHVGANSSGGTGRVLSGVTGGVPITQ